MNEETPTQGAPTPLGVVQKLLRQRELEGIRDFLATVAARTRSDGCVLWEFVNETTPDTPITPSIYALAQWFEHDGPYSIHNVPLNSSLGDVVLASKVLLVDDTLTCSEQLDHHPIAQRGGLRSILCVPLKFSDGASGALSIYREAPAAFSTVDEPSLQSWAMFVPVFLETLRDQLGYTLLASLNNAIGEAEIVLSRQEPPGPAWDHDRHFYTALAECAGRVSESLQSLEVSIFLKMPHHAHDNFECVASTIQANLERRVYNGSHTEGLTGWVLEHQKPLRVLDLKSLPADVSASGPPYDQVFWKNSANIDAICKKFFKLEPDAESPPLSFIASPILWGETAVGVIRCCALRAGLNYYGSRELSLLSQVALLIGRFWRYYLNCLETVREINSLQRLAEGLNQTNILAQKVLGEDNPARDALISECLRLLAAAIPEATGFDVRMLDESGRELFYVATAGPLWTRQSQEVISARLKTTFALADPDRSAGAWVMQKKEIFVSASPEQSLASGETFESVRGLVCAPIMYAGVPVGVVDVHVADLPSVLTRISLITQLVTQQLSLYHNLALVTWTHRLENRQRIQMLQDISHQLRNPVNQAHQRIQSALRERIDDTLKMELQRIRGLCGKAKRVTTSVKLFAALAKNEALVPDLRHIRADELIRGVIEAASDHELLLGLAKRVRIEVERRGFEAVTTKVLRADFALLMQAIDCLVDNAAKYSYMGTVCKIVASVTGRERFSISVLNRGLVLRPREAKRCIERAWRSEEAWSVTGEGSGIGLWLVDNIMKAHGGEILCLPTNSEGWTEFKLLFPLQT